MEKPSLSRIVLPKSSDLLAEKLRDMIIRGELSAGDHLPPERALVEETGLSRGSVREALRLLEADGLIEILRGRSGGIRIAAPGRDHLSRSVEIFVRVNAVSLGALVDCRLAVEPMMARLAAEHRRPDEFDELEAIHTSFTQSIHDLPAYRRINYRWHRKIAHCSRNEPLIALTDAILNVSLDAIGYERATTSETRARAVRLHKQVMDAIRDGDGPAASNAMQRHLADHSHPRTGKE